MYATSPVLPGHPELEEVSFGKPGCNDLPAVIVPGPDGEVISRWKLSDDEIGLLATSGDIYLSVKTFNRGFPPVLLRVATSDMIWDEPREVVVPKPQPPNFSPPSNGNSQDTRLAPVTANALTHEQEQVGQITPPDFTHPTMGNLYFSRYKEDGSLRLYPAGSYLNDQPAKYSEDPVNIKILVVRSDGQYMVVLPVRRAFLDTVNAEQELANRAWNWR